MEYPIVVEWQFGGSGNYQLTLLWTPPGGSIEVIPLANVSMNEKWWNGTSGAWYPQTWY